MGIHEIRDKVQVSMDRLVFSQLWLYAVQPVHKCLQSLGKLTREQQGLLQLMLPENERNSTNFNPFIFSFYFYLK